MIYLSDLDNDRCCREGSNLIKLIIARSMPFSNDSELIPTVCMYVCMYVCVCGCLRLQAQLPFSGLFQMYTKKTKQVSAWYKC